MGISLFDKKTPFTVGQYPKKKTRENPKTFFVFQ